MTTLVTGAAGFIGFHLADRLLAAGERVIGIDNFTPYYLPQLKEDRIAELQRRHSEAFVLLRTDFADPEALEHLLERVTFDRIAHLGAQPGVRYSIQNPRAYAHSNLVGHLNMLELARHRRVPMVYASSSSVYGGNTKLPFSVDDPVDHPVSLYAATKRADELMSESYSHLYRISLTGLRFFTVYGPWGRPDMAPWLFTDAILSGKPIKVFNNGDMRRDFTYIDDIIAGVVSALERPPADGVGTPHRIYNLGNNRSEPLTHLIAAIEAACGRPAIREGHPMQPGDVQLTFADIGSAKAELGFGPTTSLDEGVRRFVHWFRQYSGR
jgi:UDP-glucuronate 4-epimerase